MKKSDWQPEYDRLRPFFQDAARTFYDEGDLEKGFKFWSVSQVLMDSDLSDDEIREPLRLDGGGDLGLDGYFEDADESVVTLVQSKFHDQPIAIGNSELSKFLGCLNKVLNPAVVVESKNALVSDAHRAVKDAISKGWTIRFVFVTSGYLSAEGRVFADQKASFTEYIEGVPVVQELDVYDIERLAGLYESHLTPRKFNTDVRMSISAEDRATTTIAGFKVLLAAVRGAELVKAFRQYQYALFRLNPRGPLQNKVNATILSTLKDPNRRKLFFHLNNGITAVCDSFKDIDASTVSIRDFQIVNGCQTTVTLWKAGAIVESDDDIKVLVRVIEGLPGLRDEVATATNTQARLSAQDFKSNDPKQRNLKHEFDALPLPIFYEIKRGDWEMEQNKSRYLDSGPKTYRRLKMKDLAQATLAYLGEPGDAKDKSRTIFENESLYRRVFPDGVRAQQLLLPWRVYEAANAACGAWHAFSGAEYARFCLAALVGLDLSPAQEIASVQEAAKLAAQTDRIQSDLKRGQQAIGAVYAVMKDKYPGHREFFRSGEHFKTVVEAFKAQPV